MQMSRVVRRSAAVLAVLALGAAACGNSSDDAEPAPSTEAPDGSTATTAASGDRDTFVPIEGVPGVTDETISYDVIGTRSNNLLGTCILDCYRDGIEAYFAYRNSEGGIYGRDLVIGQELDDALSQNQVRALEVISADDAFGVFNAALLATGFADLDDAGIPTYVWGINATEQTGRLNIFPHLGVICIGCTGRAVPWAVQQLGGTRVASLGYGTTENSKRCAQGNVASLDLYGEEIGAESVYLNDNLDYGLPNGLGPDVTTMKEAGVDFIASCMDLNGDKTLAQELERQGMADVPIYHPNTYDAAFVADAGGVFDGDVVTTQFRPFESDAAGTPLEDFVQWMEETGSEPTELAMAGWINADLAFQGLLAAGPEFDQASVVAATNGIDAYTAGGLIPPVDWTRQHAAPTEDERFPGLECVSLVRVVDGTFEVLLSAEEPWACWDNEDRSWSDPEPTSFD
jgi:hypothetical protein